MVSLLTYKRALKVTICFVIGNLKPYIVALPGLGGGYGDITTVSTELKHWIGMHPLVPCL
jgi:hypothetical protein